VIPVELKEISWRTAQPPNQTANTGPLFEELDFIEESRNFTALTEGTVKQAMST